MGGYEWSDNVVWTYNGYSAVFPFESKWENRNPNVHTQTDNIGPLSIAHLVDFLKLAIAFTVEMAEPEVVQYGWAIQ